MHEKHDQDGEVSLYRASEVLLDNSLQVYLKTVNLDRELFNKITSL